MGDPGAPLEMDEQLLRQLSQTACQVRDQIFDVIGAVTSRPAADGITYADGITAELRESWLRDADPFLMMLDFSMDGDQPRLVRTCAPWTRLVEALAIDPYLPPALAEFLRRRLGASGTLAIRTASFPDAADSLSPIYKLSRLSGLDFQVAGLDVDWDDAPDLDGALILAPYLSSFLGAYGLPPPKLKLAFPLWTALLDEPGLLVHLHHFYPQDPVFPRARLVESGGRTAGDQVGVRLDGAPGIDQGLDLRMRPFMDLLRVVVSDERVLGIHQLRNADPRRAAIGQQIAVRPKCQTTPPSSTENARRH